MGISGWIQQAITAYIGLSLLGLFGDGIKNFIFIYGVILMVLFLWWLMRRVGVIPAV